jgi:hypothetical protein
MERDARSAFERSPSSGRDPHAHGFYSPAALPYGCGLRVHEPNFDKLEELDGEPRNELSVRAAPWRVSEFFEYSSV